MVARWVAFGVWAAVAVSALYWGLRLFVAAPAVPPHAVVAVGGPSAAGDLSRVLGAPEPAAAASAVVAEAVVAPAAASRVRLVGVVAPEGGQPGGARAAGPGVALIAVDGKPARAFRVGATVDGETVLRSVQQRGVTLAAGGAAAPLVLELPPLPPPATGVPVSAAAASPPAVPGTSVPPRPMPPAAPGAMPVTAPGTMPSPPSAAMQPLQDDEPDPPRAPGGESRR